MVPITLSSKYCWTAYAAPNPDEAPDFSEESGVNEEVLMNVDVPSTETSEEGSSSTTTAAPEEAPSKTPAKKHGPVASFRDPDYVPIYRREEPGGLLGLPVRLLNWVGRKLAVFITGTLFAALIAWRNKVVTHRKELLMDCVYNREPGVGILSVSNHMSMYDDPGLWSAIIPWWRMPHRLLRYSLCNDDMYFVSKYLTPIFLAGKALPVSRKAGPNQQFMKDYTEVVDEGNWCHIFAEGKINQPWRYEEGEPVLGKLRIGASKLLTHLSHSPWIIPMYHFGMHDILPEKPQKNKLRVSTPISMWPRGGNRVDVFIGKPFTVTDILEKMWQEVGGPGSVAWDNDSVLRPYQDQITARITEKILELEAEARAMRSAKK